jgi:hypothetical protein
MTPKLKGMAMTKGGKEPRSLYTLKEPKGEDVPSGSNPIAAHKMMAGHGLPSGMKRIKGER